LCLVVAAGCAQQQTGKYSGRSAFEQHRQLLRGGGLFPAGEPLPELEPVDLLAVNDDMRAFLDERIPRGKLGQERTARLILRSLLDDGLRLQYDSLKTHTAEETFYRREGNCLSFTNLYVALAREAGLTARFQEVRVPASWSEMDGTHYFSLHINVLVDLPANRQVVDFDTRTDNFRQRARIVEDGTAAAQYYNNMAVHHMVGGDLPAAFLHSRKAIGLRPNTGYFWANMGTILKRAGEPTLAEEAYLVAIDLSGEPAAASNLARLYESLGRMDLAAKYAEMAEGFRMENPYYLYGLAESAYAREDYEEAGRLLVSAIRKRNNEHRFYRLQGLTWTRLGEMSKAKRSFRKAARLSTDPQMISLYNHKLELLARRD